MNGKVYNMIESVSRFGKMPSGIHVIQGKQMIGLILAITAITAILALFLGITLLAFSDAVTGDTITVDDEGTGDYVTIQYAVENASAGDDILIMPGTYDGEVLVDKPLNITGNSSDLSIITGDGNGTVLRITSDWVNVRSLVIMNGDIGIGIESDHVIVDECLVLQNTDGIDILDGSSNTLTNNRCTGNEIGIHLSRSHGNTIADNICDTNDYYGIYLFDSDDGVMSRNVCTNNTIGIFLSDAHSNEVENSTLADNEEDGIQIRDSDDNLIHYSTIAGNTESGVYLHLSSGNDLMHNMLSQNGKGVILSGISMNNTANFNEIVDNSLFGMDASSNNGYIADARMNWWGQLSGPHHPAANANGTGDRISDDILFDPWLNDQERDFYENLTYETSDSTGSGDPNEFVNFGVRIENNASVGYDLGIRVLDTADDLTILFPGGNDVGVVNPGNSVLLSVIVLVEDNSSPGERFMNITVFSKDNTHLFKDLTFVLTVNQIYDISTQLITAPPDNKVEPAVVTNYTIEIHNSGTGNDEIFVEIPDEILGIRNIPDGWNVTANITNFWLENDQRRSIRIGVYVTQFALPDPVDIEIWIHFNNNTQKIITLITAEVNVRYKPFLNSYEQILTVIPSRNDSGVANFSVTVTNEGNVLDTMNVEFFDDASTNIYRTWVTLSPGSLLEPGESYRMDFSVRVYSLEIDPRAIADGNLKEFTLVIYSEGARASGVEVPDETTESFTGKVDIREFRYAEITSVNPWSIVVEIEEVWMINVILANLGNGPERYSLIKDGEDGVGTNTNWYDFNVSSVNIEPLTSEKVTLFLEVPQGANIGTHELFFHAESEMTFETAQDFIRVGIEEKYGGEFAYATNRSSEPGRDVRIDIGVRNTGNANHEFKMELPSMPQGWGNPNWVGGNTKDINAYSSGTFSLEISLPSDFTKAPAGLYQFEVNGLYEDEGGSETKFARSITINLTVNSVYGVEVEADDYDNEGEPGDQVHYQLEIRNSGNVNETYHLSMLHPGVLDNAKDWVSILGTDPGNKITLTVGMTKYLDIVVNIPDYSPENDDAEKGLFGFKIKAESTNDSDESAERIFELEVEAKYAVSIWSEIPEKNITLRENDPTEMTFTLNIRNMGNAFDDFDIWVPNDEFYGEKKDWIVKFGTQTIKIINLESLVQKQETLTLIIDKNTDPGEYDLDVRARSRSDTAIYTFSTIRMNLIKADYDVSLEQIEIIDHRINPSEESEIEYKFKLINTGNQEDTYTVEVESNLGSGEYKDWDMEFEDKTGSRVDTITVPTDLPDNSELFIDKGDFMEIILFVTVAKDEEEGIFDEIAISAVSNNDQSQIDYLFFNLTTILPNINVNSDPATFFIDPDNNIEEDDTVSITVKITNDGSAKTDEFYVFFYNGKRESPNELPGNYISFEIVNNIPPNQFIFVTTEWDELPPGENDIYVYADKPIRSGDGKTMIDNQFSREGLVLESRENDNTAYISDIFQTAIDMRPDLTILNVDFDDTEADSTTTVIVTIANEGTAIAERGDAIIYIKIGGVTLKGKGTNNINPSLTEDIDIGDDIDMEFIWEVPDDVRDFLVKATADHPDDSNSRNDRLSTQVTTVKKDTTEERIRTGWELVIIGLALAIATILGVAIIVSRSSETNGGHGKKIAGSPLQKRGPGGSGDRSSSQGSGRSGGGSGPSKTSSGDKGSSGGSSGTHGGDGAGKTGGSGSGSGGSGPQVKMPPSDKKAQQPPDGQASSPPPPPTARLVSSPVVKVEFPVIDRCVGCGAKLRVYKPGLIGCPFCQETAMVDKNGKFFRVYDTEDQIGDYGIGNVEDLDTMRWSLEKEMAELQMQLQEYTDELGRVRGIQVGDGGGEAGGGRGYDFVDSRRNPRIVERGRTFVNIPGLTETYDPMESRGVSGIDPYDLLAKPHWDKNELERKRKMLADYDGYEFDPQYREIVEWLYKQISIMESYGRRNVMGFPDTPFIANKKQELKSVVTKPKQWLTPREKQIIKSYPPKIRAFEKIVGMSVEDLMVELKEEELRGNMEGLRNDDESFKPNNGFTIPPIGLTHTMDFEKNDWPYEEYPVRGNEENRRKYEGDTLEGNGVGGEAGKPEGKGSGDREIMEEDIGRVMVEEDIGSNMIEEDFNKEEITEGIGEKKIGEYIEVGAITEGIGEEKIGEHIEVEAITEGMGGAVTGEHIEVEAITEGMGGGVTGERIQRRAIPDEGMEREMRGEGNEKEGIKEGMGREGTGEREEEGELAGGEREIKSRGFEY